METRKSTLALFGVFLLVVNAVLACGPKDTAPPSGAATETVQLAALEGTDSQAPTEPAATARPSDTPEPSETPPSTDTAEPSAEPPTITPTPTATLAPGQPPPPSSRQLIQQALEEGEIDAETALVYEVYASAADTRLPAEYKGDDSRQTDSLALGRAVEMWDTLSPETRRLLVPYRLPPSAPGSWLELREAEASASAGRGSSAEDRSSRALASAAGAMRAAPAAQQVQWNKVWAVEGNIKVWYQERHKARDEAIARDLASEIGSTIYPKLEGLMGRALLTDEGYPCLDDDGDPIWEGAPQVCHGDDGALDIYLVQSWEAWGEVIPYESCRNAPSFVLFNTGITEDRRSTMAHELMHVFQYLYNNCSEYDWIAEATATWAEDFVYAGDQAEQPDASDYLDDTHRPLEMTNGEREYGAYVFFFYLTNRFGDPDLVRRVWENTEGADSLDAVNEAIPGGFASVWDEFAVYNWNQPPYDHYRIWDDLWDEAAPHGGTIDVTTSSGQYPLKLPEGGLEHLSIVYKHLVFGGERCRTVTFFNGLTHELEEKEIDLVVDGLAIRDGSIVYDWEAVEADDRKGVRVQALYKIEGDSEWREVEDWTELPYLSFCRDAKAERLSELLIIFSNSKHKPRNYSIAPKELDPVVWVRSIGCWRWEGHAKAEFDVTSSESGEEFRGILALPKVVWERDKVFPDIPYPYVTYRPVEGEWTWEVRDLPSICTFTGSASGDLNGSKLGLLHTFYGVYGGPSTRRYQGGSMMVGDMPFEWWCYPDPPAPVTHGENSVGGYMWFIATEMIRRTGEVLSVKDNGQIEDHYEEERVRLDWYFEPERE